MKIRITFNGPQMNYYNGGRAENNTQRESAFCEIDLDFLYLLLKMLPSYMNILHMCKGVKKTTDQSTQIYLDAAGIPKQMPTNKHDI